MTSTQVDLNPAPHADFTAAAIDIGEQLKSRRLALGRAMDEFVVELRSSAHQLSAIESGKTDVFYGRSYYENLMFRYAKALGVSRSELISTIWPAVAASTPAEPDAAAPAPESLPERLPESAPAMVAVPALPTEALSTADPASVQAGVASGPTPHAARRAPWVGGIVGVGLVSGVVVTALWVISSPPSPEAEAPPATVVTAPVPVPEPPAAESTAPPTSEPPAAALAESTVSVPGAPPATPATGGASTASADTLTGTPTPASPANTSASSAMPALPTVLLTAGPAPTWYWVRKANEDVEQRPLAPGESVAFDAVPIYLVINDPERVTLLVGGRPYSLRANDETGRNLARIPRSALLESGANEAR